MKRSVVIVLLNLCLLTFLHAQWQQVSNGMYGGKIQGLDIYNNQRYAASYGGGMYVYDSTSGSWMSINNGITNKIILAVTHSNNAIYCGGQGGLYVSNNNGQLWNYLNLSAQVYGINAIAINGNRIFAGGALKMHYSLDNGVSWSLSDTSDGLGGMSITSIAFKGSSVFAGTFNGGVYRSDNNGASWTQLANAGTMVNVLALAVSGNFIYAGSYTGGVFRSEDNGNTWQSMNDGLSNLYIRALSVTGNTIFAATAQGLFVSAIPTNIWSPVDPFAGLTDKNLWALNTQNNKVYCGTNGEGVYYSANLGASWEPFNHGLMNVNVTAISQKGDSIFAGTGAQGIFCSLNNGMSWIPINDGLLSKSIRSLNTDGAALFAGTNGEGIFRSTTSGNYWVQKNNGLTSLNISDIVRDSARLICGTNPEGVFHSTDNGGSWTKLDNGLTGTIHALKISGNTLFAGTGNGVFRTSLDVNLWVAANNGLPNPSFCLINEFGLKDTILFTSVSGSGVFRSFDNGDTWAQCNDGLSSNDASSFGSIGDLLFTGTGGGVFYSTDNGDNWHPFNDGLGDLRINSLAIHEGYLFAGTTTSSIWRRLISDISMSIETKESAQLRVFPNPAHHVININNCFTADISEYFITDVNGKLILSGLIDTSEVIKIDIQQLHQGFYFIHLYNPQETVRTKFIKI